MLCVFLLDSEVKQLYVYICLLPLVPPSHPSAFHFSRSSQSPEQSSCCYMAASLQPSILFMAVCICQTQSLGLSLPHSISTPCQISCHRSDPVSPGLLADSVPVFGSQPSFPSSPTSLLVTVLACWGSEGVGVLICPYVNLCSSLPWSLPSTGHQSLETMDKPTTGSGAGGWTARPICCVCGVLRF